MNLFSDDPTVEEGPIVAKTLTLPPAAQRATGIQSVTGFLGPQGDWERIGTQGEAVWFNTDRLKPGSTLRVIGRTSPLGSPPISHIGLADDRLGMTTLRGYGYEVEASRRLGRVQSFVTRQVRALQA